MKYLPVILLKTVYCCKISEFVTVRFDVIMVVMTFWFLTPSTLVNKYQSFGEVYHFHLQDFFTVLG
jgi:hypothetical protein